MNIHDLRSAQAIFEKKIAKAAESRENLYKIREAFCMYFTYERIDTMQIDEYVLGIPSPEKGFNFCYTIERQLDGLGRIRGANAFKFGVYYGKTKTDKIVKYRFAKKFGITYDEAFRSVQHAIRNLLLAGENEDLRSIAKNQLSPMFKGKILSTYFPERYLNVFSPEHLDYFLTALDLDKKELVKADAIYKRKALIEFKMSDIIMRSWSLDLFSHFLYTEYPGGPGAKINLPQGLEDLLADYREPEFPTNQHPSYIELAILHPFGQPTENSRKEEGNRRSPDYDKQARKMRLLGDRGEKIVMEIEIKRLEDSGREDLAKKVDRVSLKSDSFGYDILSFDTDGKERYIEVKATAARIGPADFFYTANELRIAMEKANYYIYMVYDVTTVHPKVWPIRNPFHPENEYTKKVPVTYKVSINAKVRENP